MGQPVTQKSKREFAARIKAWRQRRGLSQAEAARVLRLPSVRTLQNWEIARSRPQGLAYTLLLEKFERET